MRTYIDIDDTLLKEARDLGGYTTLVSLDAMISIETREYRHGQRKDYLCIHR
jgi:hypothetical protein